MPRSATVLAAAAADSRIATPLGFVPEEQVGELFTPPTPLSCRAARGATSGSLILALSLGLPVVAADLPAARDLIGGEEAGWLFRPHDADSLRDALEDASANPPEARARGRRALEIAGRVDWSAAAEELARLLEGVYPLRSTR